MNEEFRTRINEFVCSMVKGYEPTATGNKIIHDPIWGSVVFYPWEVRLIDSPLFQRLRGISQVGLAESTYPAAHHTRFEHSLGTAAIASRMTEQLYNDAKQQKEIRGAVGEEEIRLIRLAGLLHDVGHCPYSHLSEAIYGRMPQFAEARAEVIALTGQPVSPSPHEVFSYLIIVSDAFVSFFYRHIRYPGVETKGQARNILTRAANLIVGAVNVNDKGEKLSYLTKVLNGNFDADKLDYTQRDSYTTGIALTYGVERFLLKLVLCKTQENGVTDYRLAITSDALSTVEELIFNRSMLYHYMYRHQKVLAAEAQMRDVLYALVRVGEIRHPCDFLTLTNRDLGALYQSRRQPFAAEGARGKTMISLYQAFTRRSLLKRAFEVGPNGLWELTIEPSAHSEGEFPSGVTEYIAFLQTCSMEEYIAERQQVAERIAAAYQRAGKPVDFDAFDLAISFQPPLISDLSITITDKQRKLLDATDAIETIRRWTEILNRSKWRGYLFVAPHIDRELAGNEFKAYLAERCQTAPRS